MKKAVGVLSSALVSIGLAVLPGCEVSVFGSEPIVIISEHSAGGTTMAHACEEPEASSRARAAMAAPGGESNDDDEAGCITRCRFSTEAREAFSCPAASVAMDANGGPRAGVLALDLRDHDGLVMTVEVCDPEGIAFHLSDSTSGAPTGGDAASSSHDADVLLSDTTLSVRAATGAGTPPSQIEGYVPEEGCSVRTFVVSEQLLYLVESERGMCGTGMFRIDPPTDEEGSPDALFYLATAGSVDGAAEGSGIRSIDFCFW